MVFSDFISDEAFMFAYAVLLSAFIGVLSAFICGSNIFAFAFCFAFPNA